MLNEVNGVHGARGEIAQLEGTALASVQGSVMAGCEGRAMGS